MTRRWVLIMVTIVLVASTLIPVWSGAALGAEYPNKPISFIVGLSAGAGTDLIARMLARHVEKALGVPVVVENRPGGEEVIAMHHTLRQPADGYTIQMVLGNTVALQVAKPEAPIKPDDFGFVICVGRQPSYFLVKGDGGLYNTLEDFIKAAKANPGKIACGGATINRIVYRRWTRQAGIETKWIMFQGGNESLTNVLGGHVDGVQMAAHISKPNIQTGKLRALAHTGESRDPALPDVPTFKEKGLDTTFYFDQAVIVAKATPTERVKILEDAFKKAVETPEFKEFAKKQSMEPLSLSGAELDKQFPAEVELIRSLSE